MDGMKPSYINNVDYTLNSAMIVDETAAFVKFLNDRSFDRFNYRTIWIKRKEWMLKTILRLLDIRPIHKYHNFVGSFLLKIQTEDRSELFDHITKSPDKPIPPKKSP